MTRAILKSIIISITIGAFAFGLLMGSSTLMMKAIADEGVPDWFRGVAGFWADGKIATSEFLDSIEFLITEKIITVPGFVSVADAEGEVAVGPSGPAGPQGPKGPQGPAGPVSVYAVKQTADVPKDEITAIKASCNPGDILLSGGYSNNRRVEIVSSHPEVDNAGKFTGNWVIYARTEVVGLGGKDETASVIILCADKTPDLHPALKLS